MEAAHEFDLPEPATPRAWLQAPSPASHSSSPFRPQQNGHGPRRREGGTARTAGPAHISPNQWMGVRDWWRRTSLWLAGAASAVAVQADQGWEGHSLHLNWENDAIRGSDRHYTQGSRI